MKSPYDTALDGAIKELSQKKGIIFCIPLQSSGSVPTPLSSRMVITEKETFFGTIGGGEMEHSVFENAKKLMDDDSKKWKIVNYEMDGMEATSEKMTCGGDVKVLIEKFTPSDLDIFECYSKIRKERLYVFDVVYFSSDENESLLHSIISYGEDETVFYGSENFKKIFEQVSDLHEIIDNLRKLKTQYYKDNLFITPVVPKPVIFLYGAGTCGISLCNAAPLGNFDIVVFDDREEQVEKLLRETTNKTVLAETTGESGEVILGSSKKFMENHPNDSYAVVMTRGHKNDLVVLRELMKLPKQPRYVGMIGSRNKISAVYSQLESEGISRDLLEKVHAPIGLPIGGDTPGEIAVSVMAELIQVKTSGKKGVFAGLHE